MASLTRKHVLSGKALKFWRLLPVFAIFVLVLGAAAQNAPTTITNTSTSTNFLAPPEGVITNEGVEAPVLPPTLLPQLQEQNEATNLLNVAPVEQPTFGPRTLGTPALQSPLAGTSVFAAPPGPPAIAPTPGIPIYGPIDLHPGLLYTFTFGNGIQAEPGVHSDTVVNTISPTLQFDLGSQWQLTYSPSYAAYSSSAFRNTWNEGVVLSGTASYENWVFGLSQTYAATDSPLVETAAQTEQESFGTALTGAYQFNSRLSLQLGLNQNLNFTTEFEDIKTWSGSAGLNYQIEPQIGVGVSFNAGYNDVNSGSSSPFQSLQGTMNFHPSTKLVLTLSCGVEEVEFVDPNASSLTTPIFSGSLNYHILPFTSLTLTGSRTENPSFYGNQFQVVTTVGGGISQQLSKKISVSLNAAYSTEPLTSIVPGPLPQFFFGAPPRSNLEEIQNNTITTYGISLNYAIIPRGNISAFYTHVENDSTQNNFSYSSSQVGFSLSYRY